MRRRRRGARRARGRRPRRRRNGDADERPRAQPTVGLDAGDARSRRARRTSHRSRRARSARVDDDLGQQRVVVRADLGAGAHPGVDTGALRQLHLGQRGRRSGGSRGRDPRRRPAPRCRGPSRRVHVAAHRASASPPRGGPSTRPGRRRVTASVTACSTWSRVFTSRNASSPASASNRNSTVPAERYADRREQAARRVEQRRRAARRRGRSRRLLHHLLVAALQRAVALAERRRRRRRRRRTPAPRRGGPARQPLEEHAAARSVCSLWRMTALDHRRQLAASSGTTLMPMPPPPAVLFTITG